MQVCLCVTGGYLPLGSSGIDIALLTFLVHSDDKHTQMYVFMRVYLDSMLSGLFPSVYAQ